MRRFVLTTLLSVALILNGTFFASAQPTQYVTVDREASETSFLKAYSYFIENRLWDSLNELNHAQKMNTYFVDTYYMRSLIYHRLGQYPDAIQAMKSYLEVRRNDYRGKLILDSLQDEWNVVKRYLHPGELDATYRFSATMARDFLTSARFTMSFALGRLNGLGKVSASPSLIYLPDTLGDRLWVFTQDGKSWSGNLSVSSPTAVVPLTLEESLLFQQDGTVSKLRSDPKLNVIHTEPLSQLQGNIVDATAVSSALVAVADRTGQRVRFFSSSSFSEVGSWSPENEGGMLFEPVAVEGFGPLLAVADRGNGRVYILDSYTLQEKKSFEAPLARDLVWGDQGELYILTEDGSLSVCFPTSNNNQLQLVLEGLPNAWTLTWVNSAPMITDITGRIWWNGFPVLPSSNLHIGAVSLRPDSVEGKKGEEILHLVGAVGGVFHGYVSKGAPEAHMIWRNDLHTATVTPEIERDTQAPLFYTTSMASVVGTEAAPVQHMEQVMADIRLRSLKGYPLPRVVVLDSRIEAKDHQLVTALPFFLKQGIRVDLVAIDRPASVILSRMSRITCGHTYFAWPSTGVSKNDYLNWHITIPLPVDPVTFGYPSEATLSFFANMHSIQFRDWLPIWPTLIDRKNTGGQADGSVD